MRSSAEHKTISEVHRDQEINAKVFAGDFQSAAIAGRFICINGE